MGSRRRKKRAEILRSLLTRIAMDGTDSGLDIDALRIVSDGVNALAGPEMGVLVITHYSAFSTTSSRTTPRMERSDLDLRWPRNGARTQGEADWVRRKRWVLRHRNDTGIRDGYEEVRVSRRRATVFRAVGASTARL
jgi:hypothetical protein